jgi:hypothetical protein
MASISARRRRSARLAREGSSTTTVAVVPMARNDRGVKRGRDGATVGVLIATCRQRW